MAWWAEREFVNGESPQAPSSHSVSSTNFTTRIYSVLAELPKSLLPKYGVEAGDLEVLALALGI